MISFIHVWIFDSRGQSGEASCIELLTSCSLKVWMCCVCVFQCRSNVKSLRGLAYYKAYTLMYQPASNRYWAHASCAVYCDDLQKQFMRQSVVQCVYPLAAQRPILLLSWSFIYKATTYLACRDENKIKINRKKKITNSYSHIRKKQKKIL